MGRLQARTVKPHSLPCLQTTKHVLEKGNDGSSLCTRGWVTQEVGGSVAVVLNTNPFLETEKNCFVGLPLCIAAQRPLAQSDM